jgi:hypothetical protein
MTDDEPQLQPDLDAARLSLEVAVQQLIQPATEHIDRDPDPDLAAEDRDRDLWLQGEHARALRRRDHAAARRALQRLTDHRRRAADQETHRARTARQTELPSLLDQLQAAVESSTSLGGPSGSGPTRSPIGLAAAELLADIAHAVRWGQLAHPDGKELAPTLAEQLREWVARSGYWRTHAAAYLAIAAQRAEQWVAKARAILTPPRTFGLVGECPACHRRTAHVRDDAGEWVRKDAVQVDYATETARCVGYGCGAVWPPEMLAWLGATMRAEEQAG